MERRGLLFVISGPAGAGKSMIAKQLVERHPDVGLSVSCTTRAPRPGEIEGVHYHFVTDEQFDELVRLESHIAQLRALTGDPAPAGRRLDFLAQEFNREVNTIASKSQDIEITRLAMDGKAEIEKLREQVQNVE